MTEKQQLIKDIQDLLNSYSDKDTTSINPNLLEFMDKDTLISIIASLIKQKESLIEENKEWLERFKKYN